MPQALLLQKGEDAIESQRRDNRHHGNGDQRLHQREAFHPLQANRLNRQSQTDGTGGGAVRFHGSKSHHAEASIKIDATRENRSPVDSVPLSV